MPAGHRQPLWHSLFPLSESFHQEGCRAEGKGSALLLYPKSTDARSKKGNYVWRYKLISWYNLLLLCEYLYKVYYNYFNTLEKVLLCKAETNWSNPAQNINLLRSISPSLFDSLSGPYIVFILRQQVNCFLVVWAQRHLAQVYWSRPVASHLLIPKTENKAKKTEMWQDHSYSSWMLNSIFVPFLHKILLTALSKQNAHFFPPGLHPAWTARNK